MSRNTPNPLYYKNRIIEVPENFFGIILNVNNKIVDPPGVTQFSAQHDMSLPDNKLYVIAEKIGDLIIAMTSFLVRWDSSHE